MHKDISEILVDSDEIDALVTRIAKEIDAAYTGEGRLLLLCILKGSVVFMGDLMKKLESPAEIDFMKVSSYGAGTRSSGNVHIKLDLDRNDIDECDIIVVEDIIDSGKTLSYLVDYLKNRGAKSVRTCTLLDKPSRREVDFNADYVGREIPDAFVVGYGLDYDEKYRSLPYVGILRPEIYTSQE